MADDDSDNENPFFFLSEHIENRGFGYDSAILGSCDHDFAFLEVDRDRMTVLGRGRPMKIFVEKFTISCYSVGGFA